MVNRSRPSSSRISQDAARPTPTTIDGPRIPPPDFGVPQEASTESIGGGTQSSTWEGDDEFRSLLQYLPSTQDTAPNSQATDPPDSAQGSLASLEVFGKRKAASGSPQRPAKVPRLDSEYNVFLDSRPQAGDPHAPFIVSSDERLESILRKKGVPYGSQWEVAHLLSTGKLKSHEIEIERLVELGKYTTNAQAVPVTAQILSKKALDPDIDVRCRLSPEAASKVYALSPWLLPYTEQDKEEAMLAKDPYAGLGFHEDEPYWFGGKIHYTARIELSDSGSRYNPFKVTLRRPELGVSSQFYRRYGSSSFLTVKLAKAVSNDRGYGDAIETFVRRPLVILGRVFRAVRRVDDSFIYFRTNEVCVGDKIPPDETVPGAPSLWDFLNAQNPLRLNTAQTMGKWSTRLALGFSTSVPGCLVEKRNVLSEIDVVSSQGSDMTDGAGFMNKAAARALRDAAGCHDIPSAVQMRIDGAKGLLVLYPEDDSEEPRVWLRPSQKKIKYAEDEPQDRSTLIINLLRTSKTKPICRLSVEAIIIMAENRVHCDVFKTLFEKSVENTYESLLPSHWEGENAMEQLYAKVNSIGGVNAARAARKDVQRARLHGHADHFFEAAKDADSDAEEVEADADPDTPYAIAGWDDPASGCPATPAEIVCTMLQAGFQPQTCEYLRAKLEWLTKRVAQKSIKQMRIDVVHSFSAWIVPDPTGKLQPGQMYFKSSSRDLVGLDGTPTDQVLGDALITRNPCKLPTDVQKWTFVDEPQLRYLFDVIVLPINGPRRPADFLGGGDYDGDKGTVYYDPQMVQQFRNAGLRYADEPESVASSFDSDVEKVGAFLERTSSLAPNEQLVELQKFLLPRPHFAVSTYSKLHLYSTIKYGARARDSVRFAYMFTKSLDGPKVGVTVKPSAFAKDSSDRRWACRMPDWKAAIDGKDEENNNNPRCTRPKDTAKKCGPFVMESLYAFSQELDRTRIKQIQDAFTDPALPRPGVDEELTAPWREAKERAGRMRVASGSGLMEEELQRIRRHVEELYEEYREVVRPQGGSPKKSSPRKSTSPRKDGPFMFSDLPQAEQRRRMRILSTKFSSGPRELLTLGNEEMSRVRASYAYIYDCEQAKGRGRSASAFPWSVAMTALCDIKAKARGPTSFVTITTDFADNMRMRRFPSQ
ncbi:RNA dependent RNA polymerase-domain-containing protein [Schizophyllum commune]